SISVAREEAILMMRILLTALLGVMLLPGGIGRSAYMGDQPEPKPESGPSLAVGLRLSAETPYAEVKKILDSVKERGVAKVSLRLVEFGEESSATVTADAKIKPKSVAGVVEALLERGISKVAVEVKK